MITSRLLSIMATLLFSTVAVANDSYEKYSTEFLAPQGVWAVNLNFTHGSISNRLDRDGNESSLSSSLVADLDSSFNSLLPLGTSLGQTSGSLKFETDILEVTAGYGVTENLSIGFKIPVGDSCSKASLDVAGGNLGVNPNFNPAAAPVGLNSPYLPINIPGISAFSKGDLDRLLQSAPYSYSDVDSHCVNGVFGPIIAASWRAYSGEYDSLILLPGIRLGRLGDEHDPDVLFQPLVDDGSTDLILRADYYRDLQHNLDLVVQFEYDIQLQDKQTRRLPNSALPLATSSSKERFKRDLGDYFILDVELGYRFWKDQLRVFAAYYQRNKGRDEYRSSQGSNTQFLERGTTLVDHEIRAGIYFDGVPAWRDGKLPLPLRLELNHWKTTGGQNNLKFNFTEFHVTFAF